MFGVASAIIAWQQYKLNQNKTKFELYEKRLEAFVALKKYLSNILTNAKVENQALVDFKWKFEEHYFLYEKDIQDYVKNIYDKSLELSRIQRKLFGYNSVPVGTERNALAEEESRLLEWLTDQLSESKIKFDKYLRIK